MRDLIVALFFLGVIVAVGCGTAQAQYQAQSPNYSLDYIEGTTQSSPAVEGVEFTAEAHETGQPHEETTLPATNSPWVLVGTIFGAALVGLVFYLLLK